jgi:drug/metabolite transporter (DMT)-like permease
MVASALGFSIMSMLVKVASARLPTGEIVLARAVVTLVASYVMVRRAGLPLWGTNRRGLALRGVLGFGGLSIGWSTAFAIACGVAGVTLVVHPSGAGLDPAGVAIALGAATCSAIAYVTVRQLVKTEHPLVIVWYFPLIATPLVVPWAVATWVTPAPLDWLLLVAIGLSTQIGQVFLTMALAIERAGRVTSIGYIQVAFAMIWQWMIFASPPTIWTLAGATLIVGGTTVIAFVSSRGAGGSPSRTPT